MYVRLLVRSQVEARRGEFGFNEIEQDEDEPLWRKYLANFKDPLIGLLLASAFVRSAEALGVLAPPFREPCVSGVYIALLF